MEYISGVSAYDAPFVAYNIMLLNMARRLRDLPGLLPVCAFALLSLAACNGLSVREKELVGKYYNTALSDMKPEIELNSDRSAVVRALRPGDLVYSVKARWEATEDSLIIRPDTVSIVVEEGDPAAVGHVPARLAWPIVKYNDQTLTLIRNRNTIDYRRRYE